MNDIDSSGSTGGPAGARPWLQVLPEAASAEAGRTDALFFALTAASAFITGVVLFLVFYAFLTRHRVKPQASGPRQERRNWFLEGGWILATLAVFLFFFAWGAKLYIDLNQPRPNPVEIGVVARQWMWEFHYPNGYRSHNELVVPAGEPVRLSMVSEDVIHSLFVPAFRMKQDVLPGRYRQMRFTPTRSGAYHLFCNEYCGTWHPSMRGVVRVLPPDEWSEWLDARRDGDFAGEGRRLFLQQGCSGCHTPGSPIRAPDLAGIFGRLVPVGAERRLVEADESYLRDSMLLPLKDIASGYAPVMPSYEGVLSEAQVMALVDYLKQLRRGDAVVEDAP